MRVLVTAGPGGSVIRGTTAFASGAQHEVLLRPGSRSTPARRWISDERKI